MEAVLAVIASLFAIVQGGVWLVGGIQKSRAKKVLAASGPVSVRSTGELQESGASLHGTAASPELPLSNLRSDAIPVGTQAASALSLTVPNSGVRNDGPGSGSTFAQPLGSQKTSVSLNAVTTPEAVVELWQTRSRFMRFARNFWHVIIIAFLPVFSVLSPLGLAVAVLLPFRNSVAAPTFYDDGPGIALGMALTLLIPGICAFWHRPTSSMHKWIRRICIVIAVLMTILFFCVIAFVEPT